MTLWRLATRYAVAAAACAFAGPAWSNGDGFFESREIPGNPELVIFGNVKDDEGRYLDNATVRVKVAEHMLEFTAQTDVIGRFRTADVGRAIKDLGYEVDPSMITVTVECPGYRQVRREYRGKYRQRKGAVEVNFRMKKGHEPDLSHVGRNTPMIAFWTILHGIVAIGLLGAATHQGLTVWRKPAPAHRFVDRFRAIPAGRFANAVAVLYVLAFALGAYIYPTFVLDVKGAVADYGMRKTIGVFQLKEHVAVIGLALLPLYWHYWRSVPPTVGINARRLLTTVVMLIVWWSLIVGHILNNVKGLQ